MMAEYFPRLGPVTAVLAILLVHYCLWRKLPSLLDVSQTALRNMPYL